MSRGDEILALIDAHWREHAEGPSIRELQRLAGLQTTSAIAYHLDRLRAAGKLLPSEFSHSRAIIPPWVREAIRTYQEKK